MYVQRYVEHNSSEVEIEGCTQDDGLGQITQEVVIEGGGNGEGVIEIKGDGGGEGECDDDVEIEIEIKTYT
ncbi:hypothetical protein LguiB_031508 [Lonicera macranthoides]